MRLILGSGSPRRRELLAQIGVTPDAVRPPDIDEAPLPREVPRAYCVRITQEKAAATQIDAGEIALCADTTVALGRRIMGKPADRDEAHSFISRLSGRRHRVITVVALKHEAKVKLRAVATTVKVKRLTEQEIQAYLSTDDWKGKAGGYSIQGPFGAYVAWLQGSYTGVVGLPLYETATLLRAAGYPVLDIGR